MGVCKVIQDLNTVPLYFAHWKPIQEFICIFNLSSRPAEVHYWVTGGVADVLRDCAAAVLYFLANSVLLSIGTDSPSLTRPLLL